VGARGQRFRFAYQGEGQHGTAQQARQDHDQRHHHLEECANDSAELRRTQVAGGQHALDDQKVRAPVAERNGEAPAEYDPCPVDPHGVVGERPRGAPHVSEILAGEVTRDSLHHSVPAARFDQAQNRDDETAQPDQEKLQNLVENRGSQPAGHDVKRHSERGDPDREMDVPAQDDLHDDGHRVHVDAAHQDGHHREGDSGERTGLFSVAQFQVAGDRVRAADVVKRQHYQGKEKNGRDGRDPIGVSDQDAVLVGGRRVAHGFQRAEVGGNETEARDPRGHLAASHEEVLARGRKALEVKADAQNQCEVQDHDDQVHGSHGQYVGSRGGSEESDR
jgi:hypothetical protein